MNRKQFMTRRVLSALLSILILLSVALPTLIVPAAAAVEIPSVVTTTPTGYTKASDVVYKTFKSGNYSGVMNWGARGEDCVFLSPNAQAFYVGGYTYDTLSARKGGTGQSNAASSELYKALQSMMKAEHDHLISYDATRPLYAYTDCVSNDASRVVSFYTGQMFSSTWDSGKTWNREHMWPRSKCLNQSKKEDSADIMMLRPESASANSSRGNKAYGEGSAFYDPGESSRGDCARVILYGYTRWGNTQYMWGASGVIENLDILLHWMEEDPVDTWEMGRNDAVECITGTRNVFVDYPEYAWLLFGREIPDDMVTPSGIAAARGSSEETRPVETQPTETAKPAETVTPDTTEDDFEMTQPDDFEMTQPDDFEMTQPDDFEMTQPDDFEMTQPDDFEMTQPDDFEMTQPDDFEMTQPDDFEMTQSEAFSTSPADPTLADEGGCQSAAGSTVIVVISLSALAALPIAARRRREE